MSRGPRHNVAIFDTWEPDEEHRCCCRDTKVVELDFDVAHWPRSSSDESATAFILRLEEMNQFAVEERIQSRNRNLARVQLAKEHPNTVHLDVHYTCCADPSLRNALEELVKVDGRHWCSFTMMGINGLGDFYSAPAMTESLYSFFVALRAFRVLNLHSCTLNRGHGLECILKAIPYLSKLKVLRLEGWQMDRISVNTLLESLQFQRSQTIRYLSLRSNLFLGEGSFAALAGNLKKVPQLSVLNVSYCSLCDNDVISLVEALKVHPSVDRVHLGGNSCHSERSVEALSNWIKQPTCRLRDINLRSLWVGFTEEGLYQRFVDLMPLFEALAENRSICNLSLSENYLEDQEILKLSHALQSRQTEKLQSLDVGDNPFKQTGAEDLLNLVKNVPTLCRIRFENHFMHYCVAELVKVLAEANHYDKVLINKPVHVALPSWPNALAKIQKQQLKEETSLDSSRATTHLFRLLRSPTGPFGHELSVRIAMQSSEQKTLKKV
ncbi:MAG: hypothetical protein SGILL_010333 [Bacillariaceae sp.]